MADKLKRMRRSSLSKRRLATLIAEATVDCYNESVGGAELCAVARRILDWVVPRATRIAWGTGGTAASLIPILRHADANHHLFNMHTGFGSSVPSIEPQFQHHANKPPFDDREKRMELLRRFNEIDGVSLPDDAIEGRTKVVLGEKVVA